jgi:hypothetical protein
MNTERVVICTTGGLLVGFLCIIGGFLSGSIPEITALAVLPIIYNRIMMGFIIGISNLKLHYLVHGALLGLLVSLINSFFILHDSIIGFFLFSLAGIIYGVLIEWVTTKIFKSPSVI